MPRRSNERLGEQDPRDQLAGSMTGRVCMVTGANGGMGQVVATALARHGATVALVCRRRAEGEALRERITDETHNPAVDLLLADLSSQSAIRSLVEQFHSRYAALHVLINNAGAQFPDRQVTQDGIERHFAVNHLAWFLLTNLLLDTLKASAPARVVNVASEAMADSRTIKIGGAPQVPLDLNDLQSERRFAPMRAYGQSKLAMVLCGYRLARELEGTGVTVNALHPGVVATSIADRIVPSPLKPLMGIVKLFLRTPERGARTIVYLATAPEIAATSGRYFIDQRERRSPPISYDRDLQEQIWQASAALVSLTPRTAPSLATP